MIGTMDPVTKWYLKNFQEFRNMTLKMLKPRRFVSNSRRLRFPILSNCLAHIKVEQLCNSRGEIITLETQAKKVVQEKDSNQFFARRGKTSLEKMKNSENGRAG